MEAEDLQERATVYMTAYSTGVNQLQKRSTSISLLALATGQPPSIFTAGGLMQASLGLRRAQPELRTLRQRLQQHLFLVLYGTLPRARQPQLSAPSTQSAIGLHDCISVVPGGCLVSEVEWAGQEDPGLLQVVRATPDLYGRERYDFVSMHRSAVQPVEATVQTGRGQQQQQQPPLQQRTLAQERWYAQLRLLFTATSAAAGTQRYAYVRWFEHAPLPHGSTDVLASAGCKRVRPQLNHGQPWYEVVPLNALLSRVYAVPKNDEADVWHISCFMPN